MRRFEEQYRLNEGDDVLNRENAIHQDVDLRLDAVEQDAEAFRAGNRADIEAILKSLEQTFGTLAAEMRGLLDQTVGGLSADIIVETAARYFLTDARRAAILSDLRGGVDASGDTLAKLLALIVGVVGGAPVGRQSLKAINDAVVANTATLNAITSGADPTLDSFAEALTRFVIDEGQIAGLMTMVGNRLRLDAAGGYGAGQIAQGLANLGIDGAETVIASAATVDVGAASGQFVQITGTTAITSFGSAAKRVRFIRFAGVLTLTYDATKLTLPGAASIVTGPGDACLATSDGSGNWTVRSYWRARPDQKVMMTGGGLSDVNQSLSDAVNLTFTAVGTTIEGRADVSFQKGANDGNGGDGYGRFVLYNDQGVAVATGYQATCSWLPTLAGYAAAGTISPSLVASGLVIGRNYRLCLQLGKNGTGGLTPVPYYQVTGVNS